MRIRSIALSAVVSIVALAGGALPAAADSPEEPTPQALGPGSVLSPQALALQDEAPEETMEPEFSRAGGYLGLGGAFALENFDISGHQDDAASISFRGGYRGLSWLAVEFLGEVLTTFDGSDSLDNDVKGFSVTVNGKLVAPLGRVEPWVMAGIGFLDIDEDRRRNRRDDFVFRSAAGLDVYLTRNWALYTEAAYFLPTGKVKRYDHATFGGGLLFRF